MKSFSCTMTSTPMSFLQGGKSGFRLSGIRWQSKGYVGSRGYNGDPYDTHDTWGIPRIRVHSIEQFKINMIDVIRLRWVDASVEFQLCNMIELLRDICIHKTSIYDNFLVYVAILVCSFIFHSFDIIFIRKTGWAWNVRMYVKNVELNKCIVVEKCM